MMPSFYPSSMSSQLPPTPPDYYDSMSKVVHDHWQLPALQLPEHQMSRNVLGKSDSREMASQYPRQNTAPMPYPYFYQETHRHGPPSYAVSTQGFPNSDGVADHRQLPLTRLPIRGLGESDRYVQAKDASTMAQPEEEKIIGGVAAHLDYEMQNMVEFVSKTAQGLYHIYSSRIYLADIDLSKSSVNTKVPVDSDFRKFVSQVLSSTRLPSSTILLGLHYLAGRMTLLSYKGQYTYGNGSVHRMLTTALLLASKFLDDNTFQNKSWSEVSNISVQDLNTLELEWLAAIGWTMHVDPQDPRGFALWHQHWQQYQADKTNSLKSLVHPSTPARPDNNLTQNHHFSFQEHVSPVTRDPTTYQSERAMGNNFRPILQCIPTTGPQYDRWRSWSAQVDYSPPSAPETGPSSPAHYNGQHRFAFNHVPQQKYQAPELAASLQAVGDGGLHLGYHTVCAQQYNTHGHGPACSCGHCSSHRKPNFIAPHYGLQSVAG